MTDPSYRLSISGVPLVFDRFAFPGSVGMVRDPLAAARGVTIGLAAALSMWIVIAALLGVV